jgi:hypothetical protein
MEAGLLAEFERPDELLRALARLRERGYRRLDAYTPYPLHGLDEALSLGRSPTPWFVLPVGLGGVAFAYAVQWYCNAHSYNLNVGGRPSFAVLAFVPIAFESMVLFSALATLGLLFYFIRLPRLSHSLFDVEGFERASVDRFFAAVDQRDPQFDAQKTQQELLEGGALRVAPFGSAR